MTIALRGSGAWVAGSTFVSPGIHASTTTGDIMVAFVGCKPFDTTISTPAGWTLLSDGTGANGSVAIGTDSGSVQWATFYREWQSGDAAPGFDIATGDAALAVVHSFSRTSVGWETPVAAKASDTSSGTDLSLSMDVDIGIMADDMLVHCAVIAGNNATFGTPTITATSATIDTPTESPSTEGTTTTGTDLEASASYALCTAGTSSAAPVCGWTLSVAQTGGGSIVRLRETDPVVGGCATGTLTVTTGAVGTVFTVSGLDFTPTAILFNWSGRNGSGAAEGDAKWGAGFATSTSARRAYTSQSDHAVGTSAADNNRFDDCCIATLTTTGAVDGKVDLNSITAGGFTLIVDDQFAAAISVQWFAWSSTNTQIVDFVEPAGTGNQDHSTSFALNTGLDDKAVIILGTGNGAFGTVDTFSCWSMGVVAGDTPVGAILSCAASDAAANMITHSYCRTGEAVAVTYSDVVQSQATLSAWLSTGFRLNWTNLDTTANRFSALVLQGDNRFQVGDALTSTGTTNQTESTTYTPTGLIVGSAAKAASSAGTVNAHDERSLGFATSASNRSCMSVLDTDAPTTSDIGVGFHTDRIYTNYDEANASKVTISGIADLVSFDESPVGFTYVMDDADPTARYFWYLSTAQGSPNITGAMAVTVPTLAVASTGIRGILGTAAAALTAVSIAATGVATADDIDGTASLAVATPVIAASGTNSITGTVALAIATPTIASTGIRGNHGSAALAVTLPVIAFGDSIALRQPTLSFTGVVGNTGSAALTVPTPSLASTGIRGNVGSAALAVATPVIAALGTNGTALFGIVAVTVPAPSISSTGVQTHVGTAAVTVAGLSVSASGNSGTSGTVAVAVAMPQFTTTVVQTQSGTAGLTVPTLAIAAAGPTNNDVTIVVGSNFQIVPTRAVVQLLTGRHEITVYDPDEQADVPDTRSDYNQEE